MQYQNLKLGNDFLISALQIHIRKDHIISTDEELFRKLNWHDCTKRDSIDHDYLDMLDNYFCVAECENWIHLLDSISCALLRKIDSYPQEINFSGELQIINETFAFSYSDEVVADYFFFYMKEGIVKRHYALHGFPGKNTINQGKEMPGESPECRTDNGVNHLTSIFDALKIKIDPHLNNARVYSFKDLNLF